MKEGTLFLNTENRIDVKFDDERYETYSGFHCGDCLNIQINNTWHPARIEYSHKRKSWYIVYSDGGYIEDIIGMRVHL